MDPDTDGPAARRIAELEYELGERRKELQALYKLSELVAGHGGALDEVFDGVVGLIPPSWQYPDRTAARIVFAGRERRDPRFREGGPVQVSPIVVAGAPAGRIEVTLLAPPPEGRAAFLAEEQALLDVIAERLGAVAAAVEREERLRHSEQRFRLAVDQFPYAFVLYDRERRIRFINARGLEMSSRREDEVLGRRDEEIQPPEVVREFLPALEEAYATGRPRHVEAHVELQTGTYDILVSYVPVLEETGEIFQVIGATWDVTELRRRERDQRELETRMRDHQKLESLGLLAGGVAHDFNNLLTIVLGNAAELRTGERDAERSERLAQIEQAAEQASDLTRQMLAYAGRRPMKRERLDATALVRDFRRLEGLSVRDWRR